MVYGTFAVCSETRQSISGRRIHTRDSAGAGKLPLASSQIPSNFAIWDKFERNFFQCPPKQKIKNRGVRRNKVPAEIPPNSSAADEFEKENLQFSPTWNIFELVLDNCCLPTIYFFVIKKHYWSVCSVVSYLSLLFPISQATC